jgi:hypothetical protein
MELPWLGNDEDEALLEALLEAPLDALQFLTSMFFFFSPGEVVAELELGDGLEPKSELVMERLLLPENDDELESELDFEMVLLLLLEDEDDRLLPVDDDELLRLFSSVRFFFSWELAPDEELTLERVELEVL